VADPVSAFVSLTQPTLHSSIITLQEKSKTLTQLQYVTVTQSPFPFFGPMLSTQGLVTLLSMEVGVTLSRQNNRPYHWSSTS